MKSPLSWRVCAVALMIAVLSMPLLQLSSSAVRGDFVGPFFVDGTVTDSAGTPIQGVDVVVVSKQGETVISTVYGVTDENGFYTVTFPTETVDYNHTIIATATYGGNQESEQAVPVDELGLTMDIQFPFEIPEFGTLIGFLAVAGVVAFVAIFLLPRRHKRALQ
jgi:hypothetical protein